MAYYLHVVAGKSLDDLVTGATAATAAAKSQFGKNVERVQVHPQLLHMQAEYGRCGAALHAASVGGGADKVAYSPLAPKTDNFKVADQAPVGLSGDAAGEEKGEASSADRAQQQDMPAWRCQFPVPRWQERLLLLLLQANVREALFAHPYAVDRHAPEA